MVSSCLPRASSNLDVNGIRRRKWLLAMPEGLDTLSSLVGTSITCYCIHAQWPYNGFWVVGSAQSARVGRSYYGEVQNSLECTSYTLLNLNCVPASSSTTLDKTS